RVATTGKFFCCHILGFWDSVERRIYMDEKPECLPEGRSEVGSNTEHWSTVHLGASDVRTNTHGSNPAQRMQYEGAQLPEAPRFSPYRLGSSMYVGECPTLLS